MIRLKRIYIEITNRCNLSCSFCSKSNRVLRDMSVEEFKIVLSKIKSYTDNIYLHVKGEPLLHPNIDRILEICDLNQIKVNITTNGTLLERRQAIMINHPCIKHINVSLHAESNDKEYLEKIWRTIDKLSQKTVIIYRLWTLKDMELDKKSTMIVEKMSKQYNLSMEIVEKLKTDKNIKIKDNIYVDKENMFVWPEDSQINLKEGYCLGGKTHIAILSDGTVVPCCLDGEGTICLGNIFMDSLEEIISSDRYKKLIEGFQKRKPSEELCQKCSYKLRFTKKKYLKLF